MFGDGVRLEFREGDPEMSGVVRVLTREVMSLNVTWSSTQDKEVVSVFQMKGYSNEGAKK